MERLWWRRFFQKIISTFKMNSADGTIHFNLSFSQNSIYLRVRLRKRFVNPQLLKQLAVYKIKEGKNS